MVARVLGATILVSVALIPIEKERLVRVMPLSAPIGTQVRLTAGSQQMSVLLDTQPSPKGGFPVLEIANLDSRMRDQLAAYLPANAWLLVDDVTATSEWYEDQTDDAPIWRLLGYILRSPRARELAIEIVISDFLSSRLRVVGSHGAEVPQRHSSLKLYLDTDGDAVLLNEQPIYIDQVQVPD